jgi:peptidoglycan/LPS O-acetylase OafA/YrhL
VLSGFLITGILLRGKATSEFVASFYVRRAFRLFPLYYLALALLLFMSQEVRTAWKYYAFYGINFWVAENQRWGVATHFWTLAVEEQFYLIWPLIILLLRRRAVSLCCIALIGAGLVFRLAGAFIWDNPFAVVLLPGSIDQLACGALLAIRRMPKLSARHAFIGAVSVIATIICWHVGGAGDLRVGGVGRVANQILFSLALPFFYILVAAAARGISGPAGRVLSHPVVSYFGRISYGIYVIHYLVIQAINRHDMWGQPGYVRFIIYVSITIILSALSWHFYEAPVNRARGRVVAALTKQIRRVESVQS